MANSQAINAVEIENDKQAVGVCPVDPSLLDESQRENEFGRIILRAIERKSAKSKEIVTPKPSKTQLISPAS